jgi:hypothetical protein
MASAAAAAQAPSSASIRDGLAMLQSRFGGKGALKLLLSSVFPLLFSLF